LRRCVYRKSEQGSLSVTGSRSSDFVHAWHHVSTQANISTPAREIIIFFAAPSLYLSNRCLTNPVNSTNPRLTSRPKHHVPIWKFIGTYRSLLQPLARRTRTKLHIDYIQPYHRRAQSREQIEHAQVAPPPCLFQLSCHIPALPH
jgi:hypothetical protein